MTDSQNCLDVTADADYIALRRRISRLRVQNNNPSNDDDEDDELTDAMLNDLIKYWKKNDTSIAKRFMQTKKERKAKEKASKLAPGTSGRRKSVEFEDLQMTKSGLRLKTHEPLHLSTSIKAKVGLPDCTGSDETLETMSVRRPRKTTNQQKMDMILKRANAKAEMSKAEEQIIKSKLESASKTSFLRADSPFRPRLGSNSSDKSSFRNRSGSGSKKDFRKRLGSDSDSSRPGSARDNKQIAAVIESEPFRKRSESESSKTRPTIRKSCNKPTLSKQISVPAVEVTKS